MSQFAPINVTCLGISSRPMNDANEDEQAREGSAESSRRLQAHEVSMEEYNDLAKRLDVMEASVGFVLTKVKSQRFSNGFFDRFILI